MEGLSVKTVAGEEKLQILQRKCHRYLYQSPVTGN